MNVLGISCFYHDAAACLVRAGRVVAASMEERFTRKKHDVEFPINAILYCLQQGGVDADHNEQGCRDDDDDAIFQTPGDEQ